MTRIAATALACACIGMVAQATAAERGGFFAGAGLTHSSMDGTARAQPNIFQSPGPPPAISIDGLPFDGDGNGWRVYAGYGLTSLFEIEASYADLGDIDSQEFGVASSSLGFQTMRVPLAVAVAQLGATFRYPFGPAFSGSLRIGLLRASFEVDATIPLVTSFTPFGGFTVVDTPVRAPDDETGWSWGVGLGWQIQPRWRAELNWRQQDVRVNQISTVGIELAWSLR